MRSTGCIDKTPVLSHRGRTLCEKGAFLDMDAVLPWPWEVVCLRSTGTQFQLGRAMPQPSLSLRVLNPSARNAWPEIRVSSGSKQSIAQMYKKGKAFLCLRAARLSSPRLKSGASRRDVVKGLLLTRRSPKRGGEAKFCPERIYLFDRFASPVKGQPIFIPGSCQSPLLL